MKKWIEYVAAMAFINVLNFFPEKFMSSVAVKLADLWFSIDKRRRAIALDNLRVAYRDEKSESELREIAIGSFRNLFTVIVELCRFFASGTIDVEEKIKVEGLDNLELVKKSGSPILLFTVHLGNWEFLSLQYSSMYFPFSFIARRLDNLLLEKRILKIRTMFNSKVIYKQGALKNSLKAIKNGEDLGILIDQNSAKKEGVFVDFFGRPACTTPLLAILALRTGSKVIPIFNVRDASGKYRFIVCKEVPIVKTGNLKSDILENTANFTKIAESFVRQYPEQWLWMHRRWKTQP